MGNARSLNSDDQKLVDNFLKGTQQWADAQYDNRNNNQPPDQFPQPPQQKDENGNSLGVSLIPNEQLPVQYAAATVDSELRLVIVVPKHS